MNALIEALHHVYGPIIKMTAKWPPVLAYGVPGIVAVLLIAAIQPSLSTTVFWLVLLVILAPLAGYVFMDYTQRQSTKGHPQPGSTTTDPKVPRQVDQSINVSTGAEAGNVVQQATDAESGIKQTAKIGKRAKVGDINQIANSPAKKR